MMPKCVTTFLADNRDSSLVDRDTTHLCRGLIRIFNNLSINVGRREIDIQHAIQEECL